MPSRPGKRDITTAASPRKRTGSDPKKLNARSASVRRTAFKSSAVSTGEGSGKTEMKVPQSTKPSTVNTGEDSGKTEI